MYENNMMYGNGAYGNQFGMAQYATNFQRPLMTQPLSQEEMAILQDKGGAFSTKVTQEDMLKSYCTHKKNGSIVAMQNPDGSWTCPICGETFEVFTLDKDEIEKDVKKVIDDMQNIKLTYLDISTEVARQYFPLIPLLEKLPKLAVMAAANWAKYEQNTNAINAGNSQYGFAAYNQMVMGGAPMGYGAPMGMPMYQNPAMYQQPVNYDPNTMVNPMNPTGAYPMQQPMMAQPQFGYQMPQQAQMMMAPNVPVAGNEFGTYAPMYGAQPQPQAPATTAANAAQVPPANPTVPQPAQAPAAQTAGAPQVDTNSFKI